MKRNILVVVFLFLATLALAQDKVHFTYSVKKLEGKKYELHIVAKMEEGWHIYSQTQPKSAIALPTSIVLKKNPLIAIATGKPKEIGKKETYKNETIGVSQYQYGGIVEFVQLVELKQAGVKTNLQGSITYQVCAEEKCLPPATVKFNVKIE